MIEYFQSAHDGSLFYIGLKIIKKFSDSRQNIIHIIRRFKGT